MPFWSGYWDKSGRVYVALLLKDILNSLYGLINYLTYNMNWLLSIFVAEVLCSDICLKSEKLEVIINWQPENYKGMFSAPGEPEPFIRCNFTLFSLIFGVARENGTYNSHSAVKIPTLLFLFFKKVRFKAVFSAFEKVGQHTIFPLQPSEIY